MPARHSLGVAFDALRANPLRTLLSTLGMVIGVGSLVAILSLGDGLEAFTRHEIEATTDLHMIQVAPVTTERVADALLRRRDVTHFTPEDEADLAAKLGDDGEVGLALSYATFWKVAGDPEESQVLVTAATPGFLRLVEATPLIGRLIEPRDLEGDGCVALISEGASVHLAGTPHAALGREMEIGDLPCTVVGVVASGSDGGGSAAHRVAIPFRHPDELPGLMDARAPNFTIRARDVTRVEELRVTTESWLSERWGAIEGRFIVSTNAQRVAQTRRAMLIFKLVMGAITGISLLVGGIGIMNVLLASINERTREIGIRRAMGARRSDIVQQFLAESITISAIGAGLGLLLGFVGSAVVMLFVARIADAPITAVFTPASMVLAVMSALAVGVVFGLYPALHAAGMSPIDALRRE